MNERNGDIFGFDADFDVKFSEGFEGGLSPNVSVTEIEGGHRISVTDEEGTKTFDVKDGVDGVDGVDGAKGERGDRGEKGDRGDRGERGDDGVSPTVSVSAISGGHRISVTDASSVKTFDVMNGIDGDGASASRGIVSFEKTDGDGSAGTVDVYTVRYTDNTSTVISIRNGSIGERGEKGEKGDKGDKGDKGEVGPAGSDASVTKAAVEAVLTGDIMSHGHSDKLSLSGGALTGAVTAHSGTDYEVYRIRNIAVKTAAETPENGALLAVYGA